MIADGNFIHDFCPTNRTTQYLGMLLPAKGDQLVYTSIPSGQSEASFGSTAIDSTSFAVENPQHDFPKKILYRRVGADSLIARIEGPGNGGATRGIDFPMRRVRCPGS